MIPVGLTRYLQSRDISINNSFKDELRKKTLSKKKGSIIVSQEDSNNWVWEVRYSDKLSWKW